MQRHNFKGQGASHGNHKKHRSPGSIGACATPARVFKGMKMAGQMGNVRITTQNLEVVEGDAERGILLVKGAVPGPNGGLVFVRNAAKSPTKATRGARNEARREIVRGWWRGNRRRARRAVRHHAQHRGDAPGRHRAARRRAIGNPQHQDAPRCAAVVPSRGARRAPAAPARVRSAPRTGAVVVWPTARSRATTASAPQEDGAPRAALRAVRPAPPRARCSWSTSGASTRPAPRPRSTCSPPSVLRVAGERDARVLLVLDRTEEAVWKSFRNLGNGSS